MGRLLIDPALPEGAKFIDASELAFSLHIKALCYCARALTDGFVPTSKPFTLVKANTAQVNGAIKHLSTTQPGASNPSWEERAGGWFLHDYDDPQYMNPMRAEVEELATKRRLAAKKGGLKSVEQRRKLFGTAQPVQKPSATDEPSSAPEANPEAPTEALASGGSEPHASEVASIGPPSPPKQTPKHPSRSQPNLPAPPSVASQPDTVSGDRVLSSEEHGDDAVLVSNGAGPTSREPSVMVQTQHLKGWLYAKRGWTDPKRQTHLHEEAQAKLIVELGLPLADVISRLDAMWEETDPDDRPSSLEYFWTRLQDEHHASLKQQRSHVRMDGPMTKLEPTVKRAPR